MIDNISVPDDIIETLLHRNSTKYNLHKASEELQELALVLNQRLLKPYKISDQMIIDEIGDVIIRLNILMKMFPIDAIISRINSKLSKYKEFNDSATYDEI